MVEWFIASDLKSEELKNSVSSNLTLSFMLYNAFYFFLQLFPLIYAPK